MYLNIKQIDILRDHNARLKTLGMKPLSHTEVATFFGPALKLKWCASPITPKNPATIDPMHDRARSRKLGRKECIKPSRKGVAYYEVARGIRVYGDFRVDDCPHIPDGCCTDCARAQRRYYGKSTHVKRA